MKNNEETSGTEGTEEEFSLIPRETLRALYAGLVKERQRGGAAKAAHAWKFDAASAAVAQDLVPGDMVVRHGKAARGFAAELERAAGVALGHKTKKTGKVTVVFGGADGAWRDALEVARVHRLPIVFVAELREEKNPQTRTRELEPGTELAHIVVDGNDLVASYRAAHEAIDRARRDRGPTLIECTAFRVKGHRQQDPVAMMKAYLRAKGILNP